MTLHEQGLIIGKFHPPHAGHRHVIASASARSRNLAVIVMGSRFENVTTADRVRWLSAEFADSNVTIIGMPDDCPEDYHSEEIWKAHSELMRIALKIRGITAVDAVYSSETYGTQLADLFGAVHVMVDAGRIAHPISGTKCRDDLAATWPSIIEPARQDLAVRIILVGAESTGTTTLTDGLTRHYRDRYPQLVGVPEFGRQYTYDKFAGLRSVRPDATLEEVVWQPEDFTTIAERQNELENEAAARCPLVVADTDSLATTLWERYYLGDDSRASRRVISRLPHRDLYLITDHDGVAFEDDGWREGEHRRAEMTEWFKEELTLEGHSWILVSGDHERRMATAVEIIDLIIAQRNSFTSSPWAVRTVLASNP